VRVFLCVGILSVRVVCDLCLVMLLITGDVFVNMMLYVMRILFRD
jgi:hypothetical protein